MPKRYSRFTRDSDDPRHPGELQRLGEFVGRDLRAVLHDLAIDRRGAVIPGRHHASLESCLEDVDRLLDKARTLLVHTRGARHRGQLAAVGLLGSQLEFKLGVFRDAHGEYSDFVYGSRESEKNERAWTKRLMTLAKNVLEAARVLVGSLAKVLPWLEGIGEIIDALIAAISIQESRQQSA